MFSIKKLINRKNDNEQSEVWHNLVLDIRYMSEVEICKFVENADVGTLKTADALTNIVDHMISSIDLYAENKFATPSTILGLRNAAQKLSEGSQTFISGIFDNLSNNDIAQECIVRKFITGTDKMMTARKMIMHTIEFEFKMVVMKVDIIDRYYRRMKNPSNDIMFKISFKQPSHISKPHKEVNKNGSDKRHRTSGNGI